MSALELSLEGELWQFMDLQIFIVTSSRIWASAGLNFLVRHAEDWRTRFLGATELTDREGLATLLPG